MKKTRLISRSRRRSSGVLFALLLWCLAPFAAFAQQSQILTIDLDRLFAETRLGAETLARLTERAQEIQAENAEIENALIAEESALTEQRASLPPDEFRVLADAFDERVQRLRAEQDEKERAFNRQQSEAQTAFFGEVRSLLAEIMLEKGAVIIMDRSEVFLSDSRVDITDEAIARINESR